MKKLISMLTMFSVSLLCACNNVQTAESSYNKANDISLTDGTYFIYKSCKSESLNKCDKIVEEWIPEKKNGKYILNFENSSNNFFLIKNTDNISVWFSSQFMENPIYGWFPTHLLVNDSQGFKISRDTFFQQYGYISDTLEPLPEYPFKNQSYILVGDKDYGYEDKSVEKISFTKHNNLYFINCSEYEKVNSHTAGVLSVACFQADTLWLKQL